MRHDRQSTQVTVLRGLVQVHTRGHPLPLRLEAGWRTQVNSQGSPRRSLSMGSLLQAWLRGLPPAERMRLDALLAELSRYRPGILRCGETVAGLRVTGSFQLDDTDAALALLAQALPVRIERRTRLYIG